MSLKTIVNAAFLGATLSDNVLHVVAKTNGGTFLEAVTTDKAVTPKSFLEAGCPGVFRRIGNCLRPYICCGNTGRRTPDNHAPRADGKPPLGTNSYMSCVSSGSIEIPVPKTGTGEIPAAITSGSDLEVDLFLSAEGTSACGNQEATNSNTPSRDVAAPAVMSPSSLSPQEEAQQKIARYNKEPEVKDEIDAKAEEFLITDPSRKVPGAEEEARLTYLDGKAFTLWAEKLGEDKTSGWKKFAALIEKMVNVAVGPGMESGSSTDNSFIQCTAPVSTRPKQIVIDLRGASIPNTLFISVSKMSEPKAKPMTFKNLLTSCVHSTADPSNNPMPKKLNNPGNEEQYCMYMWFMDIFAKIKDNRVKVKLVGSATWLWLAIGAYKTWAGNSYEEIGIELSLQTGKDWILMCDNLKQKITTKSNTAKEGNTRRS